MFHLEAATETKFDSIDDTLAFVAEEKRRIVRLPLKGVWNNGARIHADGSLGSRETSFKFNPYGFRALCNLARVSDQTLRNLRTPELASQVLNDLLSVAIGSGSAELVVDEELAIVIGVVSEKYVGYSNEAFVRDVLRSLDRKNEGELFPDTGNFTFKEAYSINSRLFLRLSSKTVQGVIAGRGGRDQDVSEIGVEMRNSMAGGHAVWLSWFIYRLICANGLISQVGGSQGRVIHSGIEANFRKRLFSSATSLISGLGAAKRMVENLGGIAFDPNKLARHLEPKTIFTIVPKRDLREEARKMTGAIDYSGIPKKEREHRQLSDSIAALPNCLGGPEALSVFNSYWREGASMYDFVNVFTEHAKDLPNSEKIETETVRRQNIWHSLGLDLSEDRPRLVG